MALGTVLARNLVHAALFLVAFFFLIACQFVLLEAEFMAAMQVLIYIGAVAILLLFGIMLTRNIQGDETTGGSLPGKLLAGFVALGLLAILYLGVVDERGGPGRRSWVDTTARDAASAVDDANPDPRSKAINNMGLEVGKELMTRFAVPFEVAGLLLTAALVGAIAVAQGEGTMIASRRGAIRTTRSSGSGTIDGDGNGQANGTTPRPEALS